MTYISWKLLFKNTEISSQQTCCHRFSAGFANCVNNEILIKLHLNVCRSNYYFKITQHVQIKFTQNFYDAMVA